MNTLDSILDDLRSRLPASLRGAYLDAYVQRRRTPMELLLARSLPDIGVSASTFEDARAELAALGMPQWVANRYLPEIEQALATGQDTRDIVRRAKEWWASTVKLDAESSPEPQTAGTRSGRAAHETRAATLVPAADGVPAYTVHRPHLWASDSAARKIVLGDAVRNSVVDGPASAEAAMRRRMQNIDAELHQRGLMLDHPEQVVAYVVEDPSVAKPEACHVCSETGKKSCTACGTEIVPYGAHGLACPKCAEQEIDAANTAAIREGWRRGDAAWDEAERSASEMSRGPTTIADHFERMFGLGGQRPTSELLIPGKTEDLSGFNRSATYWPKTVDRPHFTLVLRASSKSSPKQLLALGRKALAWFARMRGRPASHPGGPENETIVAVEWMTSSVVVTKLDSGLGVIRIPGEESRLALLADAHGWRAAFVTEPGRTAAPEAHDASIAPIDRFMAAYEPALYEALRQHPEEFAYTAAEVPTFLPQWRHALLTQDFNHHGYAIRGACKKLGIKCTKKALLAFLRPNTAHPESRGASRPSLPDPTTRRGVDGYRSEADVLADIFNEEGVWQAEPTPIRMAGTAGGVRLSIYSEQRGHTYAVALATLNDNEVDVEWLSPTLTLAQRNEITRRLRTAAMTHGEDSEAPSPLQDLIDSTEKRALELGAKPARTRSIGRVTSDNPEERRLGEAVRDLRDRSEIDEAIKWLEAGDLNLTFDIDERTSELQSVDKFMTDLWVSILDTASIALGGVRGEGRGSERVFYVSPDMIFDADSLPFLLQRVNDGAGLAGKSTLRDVVGTGRATLRKVPITIVEPGDGDDYSAKVIDQEKLLTNDSMVHANELGAQFIRSLYSHMKSLHDDLERAPKALDDVRKLLYWTGAMLDTPRCQDATHSRALESFEAAKVSYDQARQHVVTYGTTPSELASIKAPLRKAAVSAAKLATDCGEGQVDIFSVRPSLPPPERPRLPSPDEMPSRWMSGDHVIGPNGENGTIVRLEDRGEYGWHLKLDRPPGAHWQSAVGFRRVSEQSHEPPPVPPESPETPLHQQDRQSVDVLDRLVAALAEVFIVTPIRSGHGYRVVDLRSSVDFGVYKGLPRNTYLTTVSLRHSGPSEIIGEKAYLVQSTRDAGLSHDQYRAIRQFVAETVERLTDEAQGKVPPEPEPGEVRSAFRPIEKRCVCG